EQPQPPLKIRSFRLGRWRVKIAGPSPEGRSFVTRCDRYEDIPRIAGLLASITRSKCHQELVWIAPPPPWRGTRRGAHRSPAEQGRSTLVQLPARLTLFSFCSFRFRSEVGF